LGISAVVIDAVETSREFCICDGHPVCNCSVWLMLDSAALSYTP